MIYGRSFADNDIGEPLIYINSLDNVAVAIGTNSFLQKNVRSVLGNGWKIYIRKG